MATLTCFDVADYFLTQIEAKGNPCDSCIHNKKRSYYEPVIPYTPYIPIPQLWYPYPWYPEPSTASPYTWRITYTCDNGT